MTTNYAALGEFTAYSRQAKDAADRRFALLHNLSGRLARLAEAPGEVFDLAQTVRDAEAVSAADRELRAALERANQAADLAGEQPISYASLAR